MCGNKGPCCNLGPASALSQAAGLVVTACNDSSLRVWRLADGACLRTLRGHASFVHALVDVGGGRVASGGGDRMLRVWDVLSGKQLLQTPTGEGAINCAAALWRGGSDRVATGHANGKIRVWCLLHGGGVAAGLLQGHTLNVCTLAVVGGGTEQRLLASGSADLDVRLWDVDAGTCTAVLSGHTGSVCCLADLGGSGRLLSGSSDGSLRVWNTAATGGCLAVVRNAHGEGEWIIAACSLPGGAATGSLGVQGTTLRWRWDEGAGALTPDGAALWSEGGTVYSLEAAPRPPDGALRLLAGCFEGTLGVLQGTRTGVSDPPQHHLSGGHSPAHVFALAGCCIAQKLSAPRAAGCSYLVLLRPLPPHA